MWSTPFCAASTMFERRWALFLVAALAGGAVGAMEEPACSFFTLLPFTSSDAEDTAALLASRRAYSFAAAAMMAVDHFNERNGAVVSELANIETCRFKLNKPIFVDSKTDAKSSVRVLWEWAADVSKIKPCAILGPHTAEATQNVRAAALGLDIPLVNYFDDGQELAGQSNVIGLTTSTETQAKATVAFLEQFETVATWSNKGPLEVSIVDVMELVSGNLKLVQFNAGTEESWASGGLKSSGITDILVDLKTMEELSGFAEMLEEMGMLGPEYSYVLPSDLASPESLAVLDFSGPAENESSLFRLLSGAITFDRVDPTDENPEENPFRRAWREQANEAVERLNALIPTNSIYRGEKTYFQDESPVIFSSLIFDAVISIGLGGCDSETPEAPSKRPSASPGASPSTSPTNRPTFYPAPSPQGRPIYSPPRWLPPPNIAPTNSPALSSFVLGDPAAAVNLPLAPWNRRQLQIGQATLADGIANASFVGASGSVNTNETDFDSPQLGLYNIRQQDTGSLNTVLVQKYSESTAWVAIDGQKIIYRDGSSQRSSKGRKIYNYHFLSRPVRAVGIVALVVAWVSSIAAGIAVWILRNDGAVQRAQPFFMIVLCVGSFIMSVSILTLSWDESSGFTANQLSVMCASTPWLFFIGEIIVFCALFTKLWRVDKVLQFRRQAVTIGNVAAPTIVLLALTLGILIVWTVVAPWSWKRELIRQIPAESYGQCKSDVFWPFFAPLVALVFCTQGLSFFFAWKTTDIPSDFQDSEAVMYASFAQLQSWAIGIPILAVIGTGSANATYLGRILLIWIFAVSSVAVVVWPKVYKAIKLRLHPELRSSKTRVNVTGLHNKHESSRASFSHTDVYRIKSQFTTSTGNRREEDNIQEKQRPEKDRAKVILKKRPAAEDVLPERRPSNGARKLWEEEHRGDKGAGIVWEQCPDNSEIETIREQHPGLKPVRISVVSMAEI